jgi:CheY-like chemotaxis protein
MASSMPEAAAGFASAGGLVPERHVAVRAERVDIFGGKMTEIEKSRRPRRILLADDNEIIQRSVKRVAEKAGHEVIRATTGASALVTAIEQQPDLIVLDMEFPNDDGRDILKKLKADSRTAHIPVVVWSGRKGHDSDSRISLELGAEDYVEKDDALLLLRKLERVLLRLDSAPASSAAAHSGSSNKPKT